MNAQAGAQTGVAAIITASLVALSLLFLTPLFFYLPKAVLAAIIMTAVFGLIDFHEVKHLWIVKRGDLAMLVGGVVVIEDDSPTQPADLRQLRSASLAN